MLVDGQKRCLVLNLWPMEIGLRLKPATGMSSCVTLSLRQIKIEPINPQSASTTLCSSLNHCRRIAVGSTKQASACQNLQGAVNVRWRLVVFKLLTKTHIDQNVYNSHDNYASFGDRHAVMSGPAKIVNTLHAKFPKIVTSVSYKPFVRTFVQISGNKLVFAAMTKVKFDAVYERHLSKINDVDGKGMRHFMNEECSYLHSE